MKKNGWHEEYNEENEYVSEVEKNQWLDCPYKKELINLIKNSEYLETEPAIKVFEEITGIKIDEQIEELTMEEVCKELGRTIKIKK